MNARQLKLNFKHHNTKLSCFDPSYSMIFFTQNTFKLMCNQNLAVLEKNFQLLRMSFRLRFNDSTYVTT